jgi:hypothetical protein
MNWHQWLLWGFLATLLLTTLIASTQQLGLTRMSMTYLLGTMFTPDRDRARLVGMLVHLLNGWAFALVYIAIFHATGRSGWGFGALIGLCHALVVLAVLMPVLPAIHPRMASEDAGPDTRRRLEPPGFMALHYGPQTPIWSIVAHVLYGAFLGALYHPR